MNYNKIKNFRDLKVWQKAHKFVLKIYKITRKYPDDERFGLTSQLRRAVVSVTANIVEGSKRESKKELIRMLNISESSLEETKYFLLLSKDLNYITNEKYIVLLGEAEEIGRMLDGLIKSLKKKKSKK
ncbi:MAG: four helix bundle protein [Thermoplasmata archaeon]|nr:four helix bundle protein [Thermoplasmata archaeon]